MLKVDIKFKRSTQWNLQVRHHIRENANYCPSLESFCSAFNEDLRRYPRTNTGHIADAYKASVIEDRAEVVWTSPTNEKRLIAVITK